MVDITKCTGTDCPLKDSCYRFTAQGSTYQSYFMQVPYKDGKCEHYYPRDSDGYKMKSTES